MFKIDANTPIHVQRGRPGFDVSPNGWEPYTTTEDRIYEKEYVYDRVALINGRLDDDNKSEIRRLVRSGYVVVAFGRWWAIVEPQFITYLD